MPPLTACSPILGLILRTLQAGSGGGDAAAVAGEVRQLRAQVAALEIYSRQRDTAWNEKLDALVRDLKGVREELDALRPRVTPNVAGSFLTGPPPSSDLTGVAKAAVFAPRIEVDSSRRHDVIQLRLRRIEAGANRPVAELDLTSDQDGVALPVDQSGALYVVDWSTSEGFVYNLVLRDGASGQPAATVQVKLREGQGRFLFVGYRLD